MASRKKSATVQIKIRVKEEELRARLEKAAKRRGVSMNTEIVDRLKQSFEMEDRLGGPAVAQLAEIIGSTMKQVGEHAAFWATNKLHNQGEWLTQPYAFDQAKKAVEALVEAHRPPGEIVTPTINVVPFEHQTKEEADEKMAFLSRNLGELMAAGVLHNRENEK